jgi:hypothetical protein
MDRIPVRSALGAAKTIAAISLFSAMAISTAHAIPLVVTFDPSGAGLGGSITPFQSTTQNGLDSARAVINADGSFTETGILRFDVFNAPDTSPIAPGTSGLGTTYGLYLTFTATGNLVGFNPANPSAPSSGSFTSINYSLIGDPGHGNTLTAPTTGSDAVLTDVGGNDIVLAQGGSLLANSVSINDLGIPTASVVLSMTQAGTSFFAAPPDVNVFAASFTNSPGTFEFASGPGDTTFLAITGSFNNNFDKIPEPGPMLMLGTGLLLLSMLRFRPKQRGGQPLS